MDDAQPAGLTPGSSLAERLRWIAKALFAAYLLSLVGESFPFKILDPDWRLNVVNTIVDNSTIPLIGLGLVHLAVYCDPINPFLKQFQKRTARFAVWASLGFLLIIPLQLGSTFTLYGDLTSARFRELDRNAHRLEQLASAVRNSTTIDELDATLLALQGTSLSPSDRDQPLGTLRNILLDRIRKARNLLQERRRQFSIPLDPTVLVRRSFRLVITSLIFSVAYAACAQRPNSAISLLEEFQAGSLLLLERLVHQREQRLAQRAAMERQQQEEERIAALEALHRQQQEPEAHQEPIQAPWASPPPADSVDDYYGQIMLEDHAAPTEAAPFDAAQDSLPRPRDLGPRLRLPQPGPQRSVDAINQYLDRLSQDGHQGQNPEPGTTPPSQEA